MKVKDLIEELNGFNQEANVSLITSEDIFLSYICEDDATEKTTQQIFIEGCDFCQKCQFYDEGFCCVYDTDCEDVEECFQFCENY